MSRHLLSPLLSSTALVLTLAACTAPRAPSEPGGGSVGSASRSPAVVQLFTETGKPSGRADLTETPNGVDIAISVEGLSPGQHGFHIHANGACAPGPDPATGQVVAFGAAGGHFDPGQSRNHGQPGEAAHQSHAGELPNITVGPDGKGTLRYLRPGVTLSRDATSVFGRSLVVHERADDYTSDPAGNSGGRLLCGLIGEAQPGAVVGRAVIKEANAYPEGIAIDARNGTAYVGSTSEGHIWRIAPNRDTAEMFQIGGAAGRQAAFGMKVDPAGRLWVAGGPQGNVAVIDLVSGMTVGNYKSPSDVHSFLNDLAVAPDGHVYVTDSFRPVLFRVRQATGGPGTLEPWLDLTSTAIRYQPNQINLNGIVASPNGKWLLAIQLVTGQLWRVDVASKSVIPVQLNGADLRRGDGLALRGANDLYVVRNADNEIAQLQLTEDWSQARLVQRIVDPAFKFPTTAAVHQGQIKVVNAQLDKLKQPPPVLPFDVLTLKLP